jgi:hypothetical protein
MGQDEQSKEEEINLLNFLYRDAALVSSLYSQVNAGDVEKLTMTDLLSDDTSGNIGGSIKLLHGNLEYSEKSSREISRVMSPHDHKISELLKQLETDDNDLEIYDGKLLKVSGRVSLFDRKYLKDVIRFGMKLQLFDGFLETFGRQMSTSDAISPKAAALKGKDFLENIADLMASSLLLHLHTDNGIVDCLVTSEYFTIPPLELINKFGSFLPGEYIVEGICYATDHPQEPKPSYPEEEGVLSSLFAAMDFPLSFLDLPSIYLNMVPIVIYKTIG